MARPMLAGITTVYRKYSHTQHVIDRYLEGYGWNGTHHHPEMDLIALYVDQVGPDDLSRDRAARFPSLKIYPTIADALTLGTGKLAVDGVVVVGEHGSYPKTPKGQVQYPRYQFFEEIVNVFRASGRSVHLLRRGRQLRFSRSGDDPVHGGAPQGRRIRREVGAGVSRRQILRRLPRRRVASRLDGCRAVPQPHPDAGEGGIQRYLPVVRRHETAGEGSGGVPLRARRWIDILHVADDRAGEGF